MWNDDPKLSIEIEKYRDRELEKYLNQTSLEEELEDSEEEE